MEIRNQKPLAVQKSAAGLAQAASHGALCIIVSVGFLDGTSSHAPTISVAQSSPLLSGLTRLNSPCPVIAHCLVASSRIVPAIIITNACTPEACRHRCRLSAMAPHNLQGSTRHSFVSGRKPGMTIWQCYEHQARFIVSRLLHTAAGAQSHEEVPDRMDLRLFSCRVNHLVAGQVPHRCAESSRAVCVLRSDTPSSIGKIAGNLWPAGGKRCQRIPTVSLPWIFGMGLGQQSRSKSVSPSASRSLVADDLLSTRSVACHLRLDRTSRPDASRALSSDPRPLGQREGALQPPTQKAHRLPGRPLRCS